mgnify:CR=1 FL=1
MNGFALPCPDGEDNEHNARDYLEDYIPDFRDTCDVSYYAEYGRYDQDPYMGSESLRGMKSDLGLASRYEKQDQQARHHPEVPGNVGHGRQDILWKTDPVDLSVR